MDFCKLWEDISATKKLGTKVNYDSALDSFRRLTSGAPSDIGIWKTEMERIGLSSTTVGIYLRAARVVWNEGIESGLLERRDYPFGRKKIRIPSGNYRKTSNLDAGAMTELYRLYCREDCLPRDRRHSLGLFLDMYLAGGMNLADLADLTWDEIWWETDGKALQYSRKKTRDRGASACGIVIPVIPALHDLLMMETKPRKGERIFPSIIGRATSPEAVLMKVKEGNQTVRKHMHSIASQLGWSVRPSSTWARHSYATVLIRAGIPERYVSRSMGHADSGPVTFRYIDEFPLEQQLEFNSHLLVNSAGEAEIASGRLNTEIAAIARNLRSLGIPSNLIARATGISEGEMERL